MASNTETYKATYDFVLPTVVLHGGPFAAHIPSFTSWDIIAKPSPKGLTVEVVVGASDMPAASKLAETCAHRFADFLTLEFAEHVNERITPERTGQEFNSDNGGSVPLLSGEIVMVGSTVTAMLTTNISEEKFSAVVKKFEDHTALAPPPIIAAELFVAREMYFAALNTSHPIARFVILYSTMAVYSTFKLGTSMKSSQERIDAVLTSEDTTLSYYPHPNRQNKKETIFTAARNDFIHAEERGRNPSAAMTAIESLTPRFRVLVAQILRKG